MADIEADPTSLPDPAEVAATAWRTLQLPDIARLRPCLMAEAAVWSSWNETDLLSGRADAVAVEGDRVTTVLDWKSDIAPDSKARSQYARQLSEYLSATGAARGALVFMSLGEIVWIANRARWNRRVTLDREHPRLTAFGAQAQSQAEANSNSYGSPKARNRTDSGR